MTKEPESLRQYADTRRFYLHLLLSEREMKGYFSPYIPDGHAPRLGCRVKYTPDDKLLTHIENAIYDHSTLLEDYDGRILIDTDKVLFFPPDTPHDAVYAAMERVFAVAPQEIYLSEDTEVITAFTLCDGLKGFIDRTFSGLKVFSVIDVMRKEFSQREGADVQIYADLGQGHVTLLAFRNRRFVHGSVHPFTEVADVAYYIYALWHQLGLTADRGELNVSGPKNHRSELMTIMRRRINYVMMTLLPRLEESDNVPPALLF